MSNPGPVFSAGLTQRAADAVPVVNARNTILGWFHPVVVGITQQLADTDGVFRTVTREIPTSGVLQPVEEWLDRKSEGGRSWSHWTLHCLPNLTVNTNDRIAIRGKYYTVMGKTDHTEQGFVIYHLTAAQQTRGV